MLLLVSTPEAITLFSPVSQGNCVTCDSTYDSDGRTLGDADFFGQIRGAMKILNFSNEDMANIWTVVALVLHLGNIEFGGTCTAYKGNNLQIIGLSWNCRIQYSQASCYD